jgi:hypothetical protein
MTLIPICKKAVIVLLSSRSIDWMGNKGQVGYPSDVSDEE